MLKVLFRVFISLLIIALLDFLSSFIIIPSDYNAVRTSHYYYHHGLLPGKDMLTAWGSLIYPIKTNSLGMTDRSNRKVNIDPGKSSLLILGDSHSEGVGVPFNHSFAGILQDSLFKSGVDVYNASCISYSPKIALLRARYLIEEDGFIPDYIFVLIDISDLQNELVYENFEPESASRAWESFKLNAHNTLRANSSIYYLINSIRRQKELEEFNRDAQVFDQFREEDGNNNTLELYSGFFDHFDDNTLLSNPQFHGVGDWYYDDEFRQLADRGIDLGSQHIQELHSLCREHGIELIISVHPWHSQIREGMQEDYYTERWRSFAEDEGIPYLNLFPLFVNEENPEIVISRYYIKGDNHWNEFGHRMVGDSLLSWFNQMYFN